MILLDVRKFNNTQKWLKRKGYLEVKKHREEKKKKQREGFLEKENKYWIV